MHKRIRRKVARAHAPWAPAFAGATIQEIYKAARSLQDSA